MYGDGRSLVTAPKRYHIQTYGCQMNIRDSELLAAQLAEAGYVAATTADEADLTVVNTCSVREKAEHKLYSDLGRLRRRKRAQGGRIVVSGCVAQQEREAIVVRVPEVDLVIGTHQVRDFAAHLATLDAHGPHVATAWKHADPEARLGSPDKVTRSAPSVYVTIQEGCDNLCSFCIVPFTRGREVSRPIRAILDEVRMHVDRGAAEIVLLGQNVNSWGQSFAGFPPFAELLAAVHDVPGVERIRFTSPHPKDFGPDVVEAYRTLPRLCPSAHMPVQAGSNRVLEAMRRGYTAEGFLALVETLRAARPDIHFSTDLIVGFPGETREDFEASLALLDTVHFSQVYAFVYSARPGTAAAKLADPVPLSDKKTWLRELNERQNALQAIDHAPLVGSTQEVLWTACRDGVLAGRSAQGRMVHMPGADADIGRIESVIIERATAHALYGVRPVAVAAVAT